MLATKLMTATSKAGIEFVGSRTRGQGTNSSISVLLTGLSNGIATAPREGDIVIVGVASNSGSIIDFSTSDSGWTEEAELTLAQGTGRINLGIFYKVMGSTPDTTLTVDLSSTVFSYSIVYVLSNSLSLDTTSETLTFAEQPPNPPPITPVTSGAAIVVIAAQQSATAGDMTPFTSSDLTNFYQSPFSGRNLAGGCILGWASGEVDPAAFGGGSTDFNSTGAVITMAITPV